MVERGWGRIVQISSGAGRSGLAFGVSLYGAGKSGIEGFVRHLSQEVATAGVTANCLALGLMANAGGAEETAGLARTVPVGRLGTPEDVGAAAVFLASDEASWLTGQVIDLNGGATQH
jgi:3-oxoacyl-[acyl-carrier protein] reductase